MPEWFGGDVHWRSHRALVEEFCLFEVCAEPERLVAGNARDWSHSYGVEQGRSADGAVEIERRRDVARINLIVFIRHVGAAHVAKRVGLVKRVDYLVRNAAVLLAHELDMGEQIGALRERPRIVVVVRSVLR